MTYFNNKSVSVGALGSLPRQIGTHGGISFSPIFMLKNDEKKIETSKICRKTHFKRDVYFNFANF